VGDGTRINIWEDAWIPSSPTRKIVTRRGNIVFTHVSDLIDAETNSWDEEIIGELFWPTDVQRIMHIPLARGMMEDFISWNLTKTGVFSVRSCYYAEWEHQHGAKLRRNTPFGTSSSLPVWKTLWSLNVPAKIKIHCWRVLLGAIPCNGVLANRHMQPSSECTLCRTDCESIRHTLFTCPRVHEIWGILGMHGTIAQVCSFEANGGSILETSLRDTTAKAPLLSEVDRNDLVATAIWYIWWERRQATHGEVVQVPCRSAQAISTLALNYSRAKKPRRGIIRKGWTKPREDFLKLNVDAGFSIDAGSGASGAIIRDHRGHFVGASACGIPFISDAALAEARALKDGLILAGNLGCSRLEVESDCMEVIDVMKNGGNSLGPAAAIYEECSFLCRNFTEVVFAHCPREANRVADSLASNSEGSQSIVWVEEPPDYIKCLLADDVTIL
jgi:ribonuclease HI